MVFGFGLWSASVMRDHKPKPKTNPKTTLELVQQWQQRPARNQL